MAIRPLHAHSPRPTDRRLRSLLFYVADLERDAMRSVGSRRLAARFRLLVRRLEQLRPVLGLELQRTHTQALLSGYLLAVLELRGREAAEAVRLVDVLRTNTGTPAATLRELGAGACGLPPSTSAHR